MKQTTIAQAEINCYTSKQASLLFSTATTNQGRKDGLLLLVSILNFINVVYSSKSEGKEIINKISAINDSLSREPKFLSNSALLKDNSKSTPQELITIKLLEKNNTLFLETNTRENVDLAYRYTSILVLFQSVLNIENEQITQVLYESLDYIFNYYTVKSPTELESLVELSQYFSTLFADFFIN